MKSNLLLRCALACSLFTKVASASEFSAVVEHGNKRHLKTAIKGYLLPSGNRISLIAVVHSGTPEYFATIQRALDESPHVLYELPGYESYQQYKDLERFEACRQEREIAPQRLVTETVLGLQFQFDTLRFTENAIHADVDTAFEDNPRSELECLDSLQSILALCRVPYNGSSTNLEAARDAMRGAMLADGRSSSEWRKEAAENVLIAHKEPSSFMKLDERSEIAFEKLLQGLALGNPPTVTTIIYGATHMPYLENRIEKELLGKFESEIWITAWDWTEESNQKSEL